MHEENVLSDPPHGETMHDGNVLSDPPHGEKMHDGTIQRAHSWKNG